MSDALDIGDLRHTAGLRLPSAVFQYIEGGAYEEVTLRRNSRDLEALSIQQRVMADVSSRRTSTTLLGEPAALPLALAPVGLCGLAWPNGEIAAAKAARTAGIPFCLSTLSVLSVEDVAAEGGGPFWFQLYTLKDRGFCEAMLQRAWAAGCRTLLMTLDLHIRSQRHRETRHGLSIPPKITPSNIADVMLHPAWSFSMLGSKRFCFGNLIDVAGRDLFKQSAWLKDQFDPSIDPSVIRWVKDHWPGKFVLKSVMHPDDARMAVDLGADAIIVSNHGGRQMDGAPSTVSCLPAVVDAVGDRIEVLFDGGVRSGIDMLKALGLGARGCLVGRAYMYGLGAAGGPGVAQAIKLLGKELDDTMALAGLTDIHAIPAGTIMPGAPL